MDSSAGRSPQFQYVQHMLIVKNSIIIVLYKNGDPSFQLTCQMHSLSLSLSLTLRVLLFGLTLWVSLMVENHLFSTSWPAGACPSSLSSSLSSSGSLVSIALSLNSTVNDIQEKCKQ